MNLIGSGNFADVYSFEKSGEYYAKKILRKSKDSSQNDENRKRFEREVNLLKQFRHLNIINILDYCLSEEEQSYTMEQYDFNLEQYLNKNGHFSTPNNDLHDIFSKILGAVIYSHKQGIIHREI